ncbi:unnamed protein product [Medioppia subpectinata]|uniref:Uncharacterized protein n=1 Tax=Medioppia subpectinata TaxID=1979941 RepID=A0A7R9KSY4_9ACAR|nr:unnamed protein product [Medioppia subpectinata]CAG2109289.1 unnamed protein product [Medioppia subpectinata]
MAPVNRSERSPGMSSLPRQTISRGGLFSAVAEGVYLPPDTGHTAGLAQYIPEPFEAPRHLIDDCAVVVFDSIGLMCPPLPEECRLDVYEPAIGLSVERLYHRIEYILNAGVLYALFGAPVVLVQRLEPTDIVVISWDPLGGNCRNDIWAQVTGLGHPYPLCPQQHSKGNPRNTTNSKGKKRKPGSKPLSQALNCNDNDFVDFLSRCLEWNPMHRLTPDEACKHVWLAGHYNHINTLNNNHNNYVIGLLVFFEQVSASMGVSPTRIIRASSDDSLNLKLMNGKCSQNGSLGHNHSIDDPLIDGTTYLPPIL